MCGFYTSIRQRASTTSTPLAYHTNETVAAAEFRQSAGAAAPKSTLHRLEKLHRLGLVTFLSAHPRAKQMGSKKKEVLCQGLSERCDFFQVCLSTRRLRRVCLRVPA